MSHWFPIESNPDVMNRYMASLGVEEPASAEFVDVYGVTEDLLEMVPQPVLAVALVYPITKNSDIALRAKIDTQKNDFEQFSKQHDFFYTKQYIGNACGTIAMLHALLNNTGRLGTVKAGSVLANYTSLLAGKPAVERGEIVAGDTSLATAHAAAAVEGATENQPIDTSIDLHFVTLIKVGDRCVELDGRMPNPILHGTCNTEKEFLAAAGAAIQERMALNPDAIEFGITALVKKPE